MNEKLLIESENETFLLTTQDNPYNPFTHWDEWLAFDTEKGYSTCGLVARLSVNDDDMPDEWNILRMNEAIDRFIKIDPLHLYTRIYRDGHKSPETISSLEESA